MYNLATASSKFFCSAILLLFIGCASLPGNENRSESFALTDTQNTPIGQSLGQQRRKAKTPEDHSGLFPIGNGVDALVARVALSRLAEKSLDVQYYLYHSDVSGTLLTNELVTAAERGVRVRLLLDDMDMSGKDNILAQLNSHPNIQIRIFNPFVRGKSRTGQFLYRFGSVTRRMHNKAIIADNQIAIIGGRNIGDEYFGANPDLAFGDLDVAVTYPGANDISTAFDLYWNSKLSYPVENLIDHTASEEELLHGIEKLKAFVEAQQNTKYANALRNSNMVQNTKAGKIDYFWGKTEILYDNPLKISSDRDKTEYHLAPQLSPHISSVKDELIIVSPYFVPGKQGVKFLTNLKQKGVSVRILTNSLSSNDVPIVHSGYAKYRKALLKAGIELYEMNRSMLGNKAEQEKKRKLYHGSGSKTSLHAKYFILDRKASFIGSLNLDPRSVVENTEIGAVIASPALAESLAKNFDENIHRLAFKLDLDEDNNIIWEYSMEGEVSVFHEEPHTSWWERFSTMMMRVLPAESQL